MKKILLTAGVGVWLLLATQATLLAHGPFIPPPPPAPTDGPATPKTTGVNNNSNGNPSGPVDQAPAPYSGPTGEFTPDPQPDPGPEPQPIPEPPADTGGATPTRPPSGGSTPAIRGGRTGPRARGKSQAWPWLANMGVAWKAAFLPVHGNAGYDGSHASIRHALKTDPVSGGWVRENLPSIVLLYDPAQADSRKAVRALESDQRFVTGTHLFNCFRIDRRSMARRSSGVTLAAYGRDGTFIAEIKGKDRLRGAYRLLRKASLAETGKSLDKSLPRLQRALSAIAQAKYTLRTLHRQATDPATGKVRQGVAKIIRRVIEKRKGWEKELAALKQARP